MGSGNVKNLDWNVMRVPQTALSREWAKEPGSNHTDGVL
jgi:cell division inhibitor SulA